MVAAAPTQSKQKSRAKARSLPKSVLSVRINQSLNQELDNQLDSLMVDCTKSGLVEALLTKSLESPKWIHARHYNQLPEGKRAYVIFDSDNAMVEMGQADSLYEYVSNHPQLERFIADKCRIIYFVA
jgi:hypothetical protein